MHPVHIDNNRAYNPIVLMSVMIVGLGLAGCSFNSSTTVCEISGTRCGQGQLCTSDGKCAYQNGCGDNKLNSGEECYDGNLTDGDNCDSNCKKSRCGNGIRTEVEGCDDGNDVDGDGCDSNCKPTGCHNGIVTKGEECDDGNDDNRDDCVSNCERARCGDRFVRSNPARSEDLETCDDENQITEKCEYGLTSCRICDSSCHDIEGETSYCNDGLRDPLHEECDDGNDMCGTCSSNCQAFASAPAMGTIEVVKSADIIPGEAFTLSDGSTTATFEFTKDTDPAGSNIAIPLGTEDRDETSVRSVTTGIIATKGHLSIKIDAPGQVGSVIALTHKLFSITGNVPITSTVSHPFFRVTGMSGGQGGNCPQHAKCVLDEDCESNKCSMSPPNTFKTCKQ